MVLIDKIAEELKEQLYEIGETENLVKEEAIQRIQGVKQTLSTDSEEFIEGFVYADGMLAVMSVLRHSERKVVGEAFEIYSKMADFSKAREYIKSKQDIFLNLYKFMDSETNIGLRAICTAMFTKMITKFPKGGFTLFTRTAMNEAQRSKRATYDEIMEALRKDP